MGCDDITLLSCFGLTFNSVVATVTYAAGLIYLEALQIISVFNTCLLVSQLSDKSII